DGKEVKLTLTGYFWRYGIRKAIQVSIFRMNLKMFFKVVNVHDALPKREYMITVKYDRQIDRDFD
ncbi:hypothetical protein, partial [Vibrio vulnificus]|uniref:hypothetical protein n=1 Tax=Vibrio vulnificus TaxID=672 RepID=UPI003ED8D2A3